MRQPDKHASGALPLGFIIPRPRQPDRLRQRASQRLVWIAAHVPSNSFLAVGGFGAPSIEDFTVSPKPMPPAAAAAARAAAPEALMEESAMVGGAGGGGGGAGAAGAEGARKLTM